jgi:hypothetical protein
MRRAKVKTQFSLQDEIYATCEKSRNLNKNCARYSRVGGRLFPGQCRALLVAGSENLIV